MLVKAKWNVKDAAGWHGAGEVFETENDLGDAVEILVGKKPERPEKETVKETELVSAEPEKEAPKARTSSRRKTVK